MSKWDCPHCNRDDLVLAVGPKKSPVLIISEFPGVSEVRVGRPFVGKAGNILRKELAYLGVDLRQLRLTNLWLHPKTRNENCFNYGFQQAIKEGKKRKLILLLGSDAVKTFTGLNVSAITGLCITSDYLSAPTIMACPNPAIAFHKPIGEMRLALKKFSVKVHEVMK